MATVEEIGVETFGQRLRDELQRDWAVLATPILLSAWATTGPGGNARGLLLSCLQRPGHSSCDLLYRLRQASA